MPKITINGRELEFKPGQVIIQVANQAAPTIEIPQYCYHDGLSIVASCRICLAEIWMPDKATGKLMPYMGGKLMPTCQTACIEGMVVYTDSPKSVANQKAVMEYLLINHPLDCPVCDQAGECTLQDYSYEYGRGESRFQEAKVKNPKKDLGPNIYLYSDRCIMCTRCVRFTREVSGTDELLVSGRGNREEIDVFPGKPIDNELSGNVVDLCPVGALLDKDFLFAQRVWFLKSTPSIDGITASGDNILVEHNDGQVYRIKPRTNMSVNKWWITDEVRHGWKFVQREDRLAGPAHKHFGVQLKTDWERAYSDAVDGLKSAISRNKQIALLASPMISCEDAFALARSTMSLDPRAFLAVGPIPVQGVDKTFPANKPDGFKLFAEKCPNSRGVRRTLEALSKQGKHNGYVANFEQFISQVRSGEIGGVIISGNFPSDWVTPALLDALASAFVIVIDTLPSALSIRADVLLPGATWVEKAGSFENALGMIQAFESAIPVREGARPEAQIGADLFAYIKSGRPGLAPAYNADTLRTEMSRVPGLEVFATGVSLPTVAIEQQSAMAMVDL